MTDVDRWMRSGAEVTEGLRLLSIHSPNRWLDALVRKSPKRYGDLLRSALEPFATDVPLSDRITRGGRFRQEWPFLSAPDCPPELKVLAADMITAWHGYVDAHEELFRCTSPEACYEVAGRVVNNFSRNSSIRLEFQYYKEHRRVLGKHPVFATKRRLDALRRMPVTALMRREAALKGNVWRIRHELSKGDRPDLQDARALRLQQRELELAEVKRMIMEYENPGRKGT